MEAGAYIVGALRSRSIWAVSSVSSVSTPRRVSRWQVEVPFPQHLGKGCATWILILAPHNPSFWCFWEQEKIAHEESVNMWILTLFVLHFIWDFVLLCKINTPGTFSGRGKKKLIHLNSPFPYWWLFTMKSPLFPTARNNNRVKLRHCWHLELPSPPEAPSSPFFCPPNELSLVTGG